MRNKNSGGRRRTPSRNADQGVIDAGTGFTLEQAQAQTEPSAPKRASSARAKTQPRKQGGAASILSYRHTERRKNNPHVGLVNPETDPEVDATEWAYDPHIDPALQFDVSRAQIERLIDDALASGDQAAMREALQELKRLSAPYLNWAGKPERTSFEVDTVSLHVHERIDPASILAAVRKRLKEGRDGSALQPDLFAAPFENLALRDAIDFYKHERGWANRLIAGDSLLVMNSLLQKEGMAGQVQMIYLDPPYGIKYGSNFQPFVNKRDVKDRRDEDLTQEPEMVKAFRDTWELGIHSYLAYFRDRLVLAHELLRESGSVFIQISDENVHLVRNLLDEIFLPENFCGQIAYQKAPYATSTLLPPIFDTVLWYARDRNSVTYHQLYETLRDADIEQTYRYIDSDVKNSALESRFASVSLVSPGPGTGDQTIRFRERVYQPPSESHWKTAVAKLMRVGRAGRLFQASNSLRFKSRPADFPVAIRHNIWTDTITGSFTEGKVYVIQTNPKIIERCMLMTTDAGDLVLDPTCGSGTTAFVAEKWGRRWITCDTSRVAVTLAKQRLMTASYDYYELRYPHEGLRGGFIYETVPHVTLKSIANNPEIDEIWERMHPAIEEALAGLNRALQGEDPSPRPSPQGGEGGRDERERFVIGEGGRKGKELNFGKGDALLEWEVPFDFPEDWPSSARKAFDEFHAVRQAMQKKMDASIAAHAEQEILYDKPAVSRDKLRITGPFTVEAVPFPTVFALEESEQAKEADVAIARSGESARQHQWRDELLKTGIRGKGGQILKFATLETLPDLRHLHAMGTLADTGERAVVCFGPEHAALEQRKVALALNDAEKLRPAPKYIVFCAFTFDPEAAKDIDETRWAGVTLLKAQMNTDLLTEDLKKARSSNQSFWLMGQPDIDVRKRKDGKYEVEVNGFDYFDTVKGELVSGGKSKVAAWLLDTDYDERSLYPRQVFFPMAGAKDGWHKLKKEIRAELNESLLEKFHGTVSLPFEAGENRKVAVKIVDDRGIESLKIVPLD